MAKCRCESCDEPIYGERGFSSCGCGEDDCDHGRFRPGEWYLDGEEYTCEACGIVHVASCDGEVATLDAIQAEGGNCPCGGEIERNAEGMWHDGSIYQCQECGWSYEASVGCDEVTMWRVRAAR